MKSTSEKSRTTNSVSDSKEQLNMGEILKELAKQEKLKEDLKNETNTEKSNKNVPKSS